MRKQTFIIMALFATTLSACLQNDLERGGVGALGGAVVADALGGNAVTGAVIGAGVGVLCDDLNVAACQ